PWPVIARGALLASAAGPGHPLVAGSTAAASLPKRWGSSVEEVETPAVSPLVTVIVLNYNGAHLFGPCLDALAKQDLPAGLMRVWVVDNASRDGSVEILRRDYPWVTAIANGRNDGFAGGNNVGLGRVDRRVG